MKNKILFIKFFIFIPSLLIAFFVALITPPVFIYGLINLKWSVFAIISLLPLGTFSSLWLRRVYFILLPASILIIINIILTFNYQRQTPIKRGMSIENARTLFGDSKQIGKPGEIARMKGCTFATFSITNSCEVFEYNNEILYVFINNKNQIEHLFRGNCD
jgi:hypothetical protein